MHRTKGIIIFVAVVLFSLASAIMITGCDEEEKKNLVSYNIYRENLDGTHTRWRTIKPPEIKDGFICWTGRYIVEKICISGNVTVMTEKIIMPAIAKEKESE